MAEDSTNQKFWMDHSGSNFVQMGCFYFNVNQDGIDLCTNANGINDECNVN